MTFWYDGGAGICDGSCLDARPIIACTSCAAASMFRLKSNCSVMSVPPCVLVELMLVRPEMVANCFSSGSATDEAIVSGLAPGSAALTRMRRQVDARQIGDRQLEIGQHAEHDDAQHEERGGDRPPDEDRGEIHDAAFGSAG